MPCESLIASLLFLPVLSVVRGRYHTSCKRQQKARSYLPFKFIVDLSEKGYSSLSSRAEISSGVVVAYTAPREPSIVFLSVS
jgi:hypothetical protein